MRALTILVALLVVSTTTYAAGPTRANIYFRGWSITPFRAESPQDIRRIAKAGSYRMFHVIAAGELRDLIAILDLSHLRPMRGDPRGDTALVVDLYDSGGIRKTYRAGAGYLFTADCRSGREIDDTFRKYFERLTP